MGKPSTTSLRPTTEVVLDLWDKVAPPLTAADLAGIGDWADEVDNEEFLALHHYYNEAVAQLGLLSDRARPPTSLQAQRQQEATERCGELEATLARRDEELRMLGLQLREEKALVKSLQKAQKDQCSQERASKIQMTAAERKAQELQEKVKLLTEQLEEQASRSAKAEMVAAALADELSSLRAQSVTATAAVILRPAARLPKGQEAAGHVSSAEAGSSRGLQGITTGLKPPSALLLCEIECPQQAANTGSRPATPERRPRQGAWPQRCGYSSSEDEVAPAVPGHCCDIGSGVPDNGSNTGSSRSDTKDEDCGSTGCETSSIQDQSGSRHGVRGLSHSAAGWESEQQDAQTDPGEVLLAALQGRLCRPASADHTHGRSNRPVAIPPSAARSQDSAPQPQPQPLPTTHPRAGRAAHVGPPAAQLRPDISARLSPAMAARLGIHGASAAQPACPRAAPPAYPRAATAARQTAATTSARGRSQADDGRNTATKISERRASRQADNLCAPTSSAGIRTEQLMSGWRRSTRQSASRRR